MNFDSKSDSDPLSFDWSPLLEAFPNAISRRRFLLLMTAFGLIPDNLVTAAVAENSDPAPTPSPTPVTAFVQGAKSVGGVTVGYLAGRGATAAILAVAPQATVTAGLVGALTGKFVGQPAGESAFGGVANAIENIPSYAQAVGDWTNYYNLFSMLANQNPSNPPNVSPYPPTPGYPPHF
jgi:hypothetical protein